MFRQTGTPHPLFSLVTINVLLWLITLAAAYLLPDLRAEAVSMCTVFSAALGAMVVPATASRLTLWGVLTALISTALLSTAYFHVAGVRLGMNVGGKGDAWRAALVFTLLYAAVFTLTYVIVFTDNFIRRTVTRK
jgi:hypothetical protein